jgi:hypothetical protein
MKRLILLTSSLIFLTNVMAKEFDIDLPYYGVNVYQSATGSGYGSSINLNFNVQKFNRVFELGVMLNSKNQRFMGFEFMFKRFIGFNSPYGYTKLIKPFFYYNFLYRAPTDIIVSPTLMKSASTNPIELGGTMTTFEHAIGFGLQMRLVGQLYMEGVAGGGVYFGSRYQGSVPDSWGIHRNNFGFVPSFKFGLGFQF